MAHLLVFVTCPDAPKAADIAKDLVNRKLAACGNILPGIRSIYRWEGKVHDDTECLLLLKTTDARYPELQDRIRKLHPYELPEIIAVNLEQGLPDYLTWVTESVR